MASTQPPVTVYWRPWCGFCARLLSALDEADLVYEKRNIWDDPEAAEYVRSVANGNETVPTVKIGPTALVNPSVEAVLAAVGG